MSSRRLAEIGAPAVRADSSDSTKDDGRPVRQPELDVYPAVAIAVEASEPGLLAPVRPRVTNAENILALHPRAFRGVRRRGRALGADTDAILLGELGMAEDHLARLREDGTIA